MSFFASLHAGQDWGLLVLRLIVGVTFLAHGRYKWGMWKQKPSEKLPASMLNIVRLLSICEPLGGAALILGFLTQLAAFGLAIIMLGAINLKIRTMKAPYMVTEEKVGWEFELLILGGAVALIFTGGGAIALDHVWFGL
ncbi:MAG: DoxX family protein [SAR324 cluster bacterium]